MDGHAARGVKADEHLRIACSRQSYLNVNESPVIESFFMVPVMLGRIRPLPINVSANTNVVLHVFS